MINPQEILQKIEGEVLSSPPAPPRSNTAESIRGILSALVQWVTENDFTPEHEWDGTRIRFLRADGVAGPWIELKGTKGDIPEHVWVGSSVSFQNPDGTFDLPINLKGDKGDKGVKFRGAWQPNTFYAADDVVTFSGSTYRRLADGISGSSLTLANYEVLAQGGSVAGERTITPEKTTFVGVGRNIFNKIDPNNQPDKYVLWNTGKLANNSTYIASHFMPVPAGGNIAVPSITQTAFYSGPNEDSYISGVNSGGSSKTFPIPAGAAYMRMSILKSQVDTWMVVVGTVLPEQYQGFYILNGVDFSDLFLITRMIAENAIISSKLADFAVVAEKLGIGSVVADRIAKAAVLPEMASFLKTGKQKFNINHPDNKPDTYVGPDTKGATNPNTSYNSTHFIPVSAITHYPSFKHQIAYYDLNRNYISGETNTRTDQAITPPAGAEWARFSVSKAAWATFMVSEGNASAPWESFYYEFNGIRVSVSDAAIITAKLADLAVSTAKIALKAITTDRIADNAVTPFQTNFILESVGKQKFNKATVEAGMYQNETGFRGGNAGYALSAFIKVEVGKTYTGKGSNNGFRYVTYFNASQQWVGGVKDAGQQFTPPAGVAFVKITIYTVDLDSFMLVLGNAAAPWEVYTTVYDLVMADKPLRATALSESLYADIAKYIKENQVLDSPVQGGDFSIAPKYYWPVGKEFNLYTENTLLNYDLWKGHVDLSVSGISGAVQTGRSLKCKPTADGTYNISGSFLNAKFDVAFNIVSQIRAVELINTNPVVVQIVGDSYTRRGTFIEQLMAMIPQGVTFVGIRDSANSNPSVRCEGRGGWTLVQYVTLSKVWYSPFVHPLEGSYLYMGNTEFWIKANQGLPDSVGQGYDYNWFNVKGQFNTSTGYPLAPRANDVMYDNAQAKFFYWDGSAWLEIAESTLNFGVSYAKYRQAWNIPAVHIIHLLLGTNDFAGATMSTFAGLYASFKTRYDSLIASIKAALPGVKIVIGIPVSSGRQGCDGVGTTERRKRVFKSLHNALIADYANREGENLYIADYHSTVDRVYGYGKSYSKPFEEYTGTETLTLTAQQTEAYTSDTVHINKDGFAQMGLQFMGIVQALRP
ncbi:hypothetical protein BWI97_08765 [Siphonobacter sp. BAB-5405]|uniref:SGNH/GDSL hydrolase family protein n=1 Tax=Siphonobacter sp. BAB-5405 TaxID=1864825 RepID=UPI000C802FD6|nr:SGNH/GDSL hydrolase family protein [Siphonobacter sp. BAB-5405]PMD97691.1 hypothetical protein BWI97_08765 [Siphonobacter sp. BAB-5405]